MANPRTTDAIIALWVNQDATNSARSTSGSVFFAGRTLYSYRESWPLAIFVGKRQALVNSTRFSATTARHRFKVLAAMRAAGIEAIHVSLDSMLTVNQAIWEGRSQNAIRAARRAANA